MNNCEKDVVSNEVYPIVVLLVDDQPIIAEVIQQMLSDQKNIDFHYCSDPKIAIEMAIQIKPTVILQDLVMPDCDGLVLVKAFRVNALTHDVPIIVLSAKEDSITKAEAFSIGANDYLVKLPDKMELIARLCYHSQSYIHLLERNEAYQQLEESEDNLKKELGEAAGYVKSLLPLPMQTPLNIQWRFFPSTQLGGDAFGYHWIDQDYLAIYLLDVCGHGVGAALLSVSIINALRLHYLSHTDFKDPSSVLKNLNSMFPMEKHNNMFFTIWYGVFNTKEKILTFSSGGHPPALLLREKNHPAIELKTTGVVIGALSKADFNNISIPIKTNDHLYLFSDGIYEIKTSEGHFLELSEFIQLITDFYSEEKQLCLDHLIAKVHALQKPQENFTDDVSILEIIFD